MSDFTMAEDQNVRFSTVVNISPWVIWCTHTFGMYKNIRAYVPKHEKVALEWACIHHPPQLQALKAVRQGVKALVRDGELSTARAQQVDAQHLERLAIDPAEVHLIAT